MAQQEAGVRIVAGALTIVALAAVWVGIVTSLPSQVDLMAVSNHPSTSAVSMGRASSVFKAASDRGESPSEPTVDLTFPGSAPLKPAGSIEGTESSTPVHASGPPISDARSAQVARIKCEAEIEQLCPDSDDGPGRARCFERKSSQLPASCQQQLQERFVRWKEDRTRILSACQEDAKRLCAGIRPGDGRVMQCLQDHSQAVSDRCYQTLPKGALLFRQ